MCLFADAILVDHRGRDGHFWWKSETSKTGGVCSSGGKGWKGPKIILLKEKNLFCLCLSIRRTCSVQIPAFCVYEIHSALLHSVATVWASVKHRPMRMLPGCHLCLLVAILSRYTPTRCHVFVWFCLADMFSCKQVGSHLCVPNGVQHPP